MQKNAGVTLAFFLMSEFVYFQGIQCWEKKLNSIKNLEKNIAIFTLHNYERRSDS